MPNKVVTTEDVVASISDGMTVAIGGWGSRRKPMALVRALLRSPVRDLTLISYGGPDVGLLCAAGKVRRLVYGFVSLDSIPLDPHFRAARQNGTVEVAEYDEGMVLAGLRAGASRLPFMPTRAGLGSDVLELNPQLRTITSPYADGEELVAMPALHADVALVHMNRADHHGNAQYLGPDPYMDDVLCMASSRAFVSCERLVDTAELTAAGPPQSLLLNRAITTGVVETPRGAHFTSCAPDYDRDEEFQRHYATAAKDPTAWQKFVSEFLAGDEDTYHDAVDTFHTRTPEEAAG